ncbi:class I SAM-dependent methyltransferase [Nocardia arthritidis]|uniref:Methyltransferase domain-containing protein n=1 Tax=Nocardia arthritidis TaxID=228602 RepID=A0A6G9YP44_9NOCA|nr:class I SAM-dependent methyltransferase [Nocardia arthritidis]QIS15069.1 methyltransferase domain-containing protein [Nocardia arthritidis]
MVEKGKVEAQQAADAAARELAAGFVTRDDPTGWFEPLYAAAANGQATVPWDRDVPNQLLVEWFERRAAAGSGRALVIGCGYGTDAEYVAAQGFRTTAFDISETAIRGAAQRHPGSPVEYVVADLLDPPAAWTGAFDLVVESITVQSMPLSVREPAIANVGRMVAPAGELVVIAGIRAEGATADGPPWPLTRTELESFGSDGLRAVEIEQVAEVNRWRATFSKA